MTIERKAINIKMIKHLREKNHLSQAQVAHAIELKSTDMYTRRENGDYKFQASELMALSELYKTKLELFFV